MVSKKLRINNCPVILSDRSEAQGVEGSAVTLRIALNTAVAKRYPCVARGLKKPGQAFTEVQVKKGSVQFAKVPYQKLKAKQKELFNFQKIAALLADYGYNCIKLADDWQGADFLAYHIDGETTLKVQLKSRLTINKKYRGNGKDIWIAFSHQHEWYVVEHDDLIEKVAMHTVWLSSDSWKIKGEYSSTSINPKLLASLEESKRGPVYGADFFEDQERAHPAKST